MDDRFKARQIEWDNFFNNYRTIISNAEHQEQQHHDHNAATKIQSIVRGFLQRKFEFDFLEQESAVIIQASLRGFFYRKQLRFNSDTQQDHFDEMNHLDNLLHNFVIDFKEITDE
eukprot:12508714-Ditylum_brightwellii.AAC.1